MISRAVSTWIADSSMITQMSRWIYDVNVCKNKRWAPNIRGVQFQRTDRTIFIKIKNASFSLWFQSRFSKFWIFYEVIILLNVSRTVRYIKWRIFIFIKFVYLPLIGPSWNRLWIILLETPETLWQINTHSNTGYFIFIKH